MMNEERARALVDRIVRLPERQREELAALLEETLDALEVKADAMAPDVRAVFEAAAREHAATIAYLKDR